MTDVTKRILPGDSKYFSLDAVLPEHLRENAKFIEFMSEYFKWMQLDESSPVTVINQLNQYRNIDLISEDFIIFLEKEYASTIPSKLNSVDKRKLYKQVNDIYRAKGSIPSFEALFNLLYADDIELYYPRVDLMKLSDGDWNESESRYLSKGGFLSNYNFIQDSFYYQDYSYVIKTKKPFEQWQGAVKKLLHPSGFIVFGGVLIVSQAVEKKLKSPKIQPGSFFTSSNNIIPIYRPVVIASTKVVETTSTIQVIYLSIANVFGPGFAVLEKIKFLITSPMSLYKDFTLADVKNKRGFNILPGSSISISTI